MRSIFSIALIGLAVLVSDQSYAAPKMSSQPSVVFDSTDFDSTSGTRQFNFEADGASYEFELKVKDLGEGSYSKQLSIKEVSTGRASNEFRLYTSTMDRIFVAKLKGEKSFKLYCVTSED